MGTNMAGEVLSLRKLLSADGASPLLLACPDLALRCRHGHARWLGHMVSARRWQQLRAFSSCVPIAGHVDLCGGGEISPHRQGEQTFGRSSGTTHTLHALHVERLETAR